MKEADNILRILKETKKALVENDSYSIKQLSNQTIHSATIYQDPDNIIVAVLVYALGKLVERENYREMDGWKDFYEEVMKNWDLAISYLENQEIEKFRLAIGRIRNSINKISTDLKDYIHDIFQKAEINKAFKIYEHGLSAEQTAEMLGISLWDLAAYIGQSSISESTVSDTVPIRERIKLVEYMFS